MEEWHGVRWVGMHIAYHCDCAQCKRMTVCAHTRRKHLRRSETQAMTSGIVGAHIIGESIHQLTP